MRKLLVALAFVSIASTAQAADKYYTQAGGGTGANCGSAHSLAQLNSNADSLGAGDTAHLCSTFTISVGATGITVPVSGTSGSPFTILFETGAVLQSDAAGIFIAGTNKTYVTIDGGSNGVIKNTRNGTSGGGCPGGTCTHQDTVQGIRMTGCTGCTFKNLTIQDLYVRTSTSDTAANVQAINSIYWDGSNTTVSGNTVFNGGWQIFNSYDNGQTNVQIYSNDCYNSAHCIIGSTSSGSSGTGWYIHDNHLHDYAYWDESGNTYHEAGIHFYGFCDGGGANCTNSTGLYIYNNRFDNPGGNMTGWVFTEGGANIGGTPWTQTGACYLFNNIGIGSKFGVHCKNGLMANNTAIGSGNAQNYALLAPDNPDTGWTWQNNNVGYNGNLTNVAAAANYVSGAALDYNYYFNASSFGLFIGLGCNTGSFSSWKTCLNSGGLSNAESHSQDQTGGSGGIDLSTGAIQMGSAAIAGCKNLTTLMTALAIPGDPGLKDIDGAARDASAAWDCGAKNYSGTTPTLYTLTINSANPATGCGVTATADANGKSSGNTPTTFTYAAGANPAIVAPATCGGNSFVSWSSSCTSAVTVTCTQTSIAASATLTATFTPPAPVSLTLNSTNPTNVSITCTGNMAMSAPFTLMYTSGTQVDCTAPATSGGNTLVSISSCQNTALPGCNIPSLASDTTLTYNYQTPPAPGACLVSNGSFQNFPFTPSASTFTVYLDAIPYGSPMDGVIGFSNGAPTSYSNLAVIARFNNSGTVDMWDQAGMNYAADNSFTYLTGVSYRFRFVIDQAAGTYNGYVTAPGGMEVQIASGNTFRTGAVTLDHWATTSEVAYTQACNLNVIPPAPPSNGGSGGVGIIVKYAPGDTFKTVTQAAVRAAPNPTSAVTKTLGNGSVGTIIDGPYRDTASNTTWWKIQRGFIWEVQIRQ